MPKVRDLRIRYKIALLLNLFSVFILLFVSVLYAHQFKAALKERILLQLSSIRQLKMIQIENLAYDQVQEIETMLPHLYNDTYLDALASDQLIHIDSIIVESTGHPNVSFNVDSIVATDISTLKNDGRIHMVFQVPYQGERYKFYTTPQKIQKILSERTGMGKTGETYIVGEDYFLRSSSRFLTDSIPTHIKSRTKAVEAALSNGEGTMKHLDYRNIEVYSSYALMEFHGMRWVILSEIDREEALLPMRNMVKRIYAMALILLGVAMALSYIISKYVVNPILILKDSLIHISKGEITPTRQWNSSDEIGDLFQTLDQYVTTNEQIILFANEIASGKSGSDMPQRSKNDKLVIALNHMKNQLSQLKERERLLVLKSQRQLMAGEEKERSRLSRELHDGVASMLTSLKHNVQQQLAPSTQQEELIQLIQQVIDEIRKLSVNLMPSVIRDFGLIAGLESFLGVQFKNSPIELRFDHSCDGASDIPQDLALHLFRIVQEAIQNTFKHAKATEVIVTVTEFSEQVNLYIADNGKGFKEGNIKHGNGLLNMKERVNMYNGHWEIYSSEAGTIIEIEIPKQVEL